LKRGIDPLQAAGRWSGLAVADRDSARGGVSPHHGDRDVTVLYEAPPMQAGPKTVHGPRARLGLVRFHALARRSVPMQAKRAAHRGLGFIRQGNIWLGRIQRLCQFG